LRSRRVHTSGRPSMLADVCIVHCARTVIAPVIGSRTCMQTACVCTHTLFQVQRCMCTDARAVPENGNGRAPCVCHALPHTHTVCVRRCEMCWVCACASSGLEEQRVSYRGLLRHLTQARAVELHLRVPSARMRTQTGKKETVCEVSRSSRTDDVCERVGGVRARWLEREW
jgi:hypothetical protein